MALTSVSIVIPVYNEEPNLRELHDRVADVCRANGYRYEIIIVDDGSTDGTLSVLRELAARDQSFCYLSLGRNFGQTAALAAGLDHATGDFVVTMDGDLQNDPADIPKLIARAMEGYDLVAGWRKERRDPFFTKVMPSRIANALIRAFTGVPFHDTGCTLKVIRRAIITRLHLYGEMHRFIPALLYWKGARLAEVEVTHHARHTGRSKYRVFRIGHVLLDLLTVKFLLSYSTRPIHMFGKLGFYSFFMSLVSFVMLVLMKVHWGVDMTGNPFILLCVLFALVGIQLITIGLLGEITIRTYYEVGGKNIYSIAERARQDHRDSESQG
ncbi:MAG: glycosyltransferase [Chitinivibrionales bacterium]|nr:glycosyltransferase [Chitinivibrionales bacterium]MBD3395697.1 glycosyltransferase [Chitinivibrionales bacterium]